MQLFFPHWVASLVEWFQVTTNFPKFVNTHIWIWPAAETVHFIGLCLLVGTIGVFDLRLLGVGRGLSPRILQKLVPWSVLGFAMCFATGLIFVFGNFFSVNAYLNNPAFKWKIGFIMLAGLNVLLFSVCGVAKQCENLLDDEPTPLGAKLIGATSLLLWTSIIVLGRFLPILGDSF